MNTNLPFETLEVITPEDYSMIAINVIGWNKQMRNEYKIFSISSTKYKGNIVPYLQTRNHVTEKEGIEMYQIDTWEKITIISAHDVFYHLEDELDEEERIMLEPFRDQMYTMIKTGDGWKPEDRLYKVNDEWNYHGEHNALVKRTAIAISPKAKGIFKGFYDEIR